MKKSFGYSLIDLMLTVAILAILASIAIQNFKKFKEKAIDSEAKVFMSSMYMAQKSYFAYSNGYTNNFFALDISLEGELVFDCGLGIPPALVSYGPNDDLTYSKVAAATYLYCEITGRCKINLDRHGPGSANPQGAVNNLASPPTFSMRCHRHNASGAEHTFRIDSTRTIVLEKNAF